MTESNRTPPSEGVKRLCVGRPLRPGSHVTEVHWGPCCQHWYWCCELGIQETVLHCTLLHSSRVYALCPAAKESMWMTDFLISLGVLVYNVIIINTDNQGSIVAVLHLQRTQSSVTTQNTLISSFTSPATYSRKVRPALIMCQQQRWQQISSPSPCLMLSTSTS